MYKTIRHGENSLQYTILPQNDDFRIEGKLSSAGSSCNNSGKSRKSKVKRPRRRSFFAYLGLIFVCTVIIGAILIPFLVSAECLPNPTKWFLKTKTALIRQSNPEATSTTDSAVSASNHRATGNIEKEKPSGGRGKETSHTPIDGNKSSLNEAASKLPLVEKNQTNAPHQNNQDNSQTYQQSANITDIAISLGNEAASATEISQGQQSGKGFYTVQHKHDDDVVLNFVTKGDSPPSQNTAVEQYLNNSQNNIATSSATGRASNIQMKPTVPTSTSTIQQQQQLKQQQEPLNPNQIDYSPLLQSTPSALPNAVNINSPRLLASNSVGSPAAAQSSPTITTRIIQVPLLKSTAKKAFIPPALANTNPLPPHVGHSDANGTTSAIAKSVGSPPTNASSSSSSPPSPVAIISSNSASPLTTKFANAKTNIRTKSDWIQAHWPYVDPSTYFQWTGYKAEDSVLLPALLGFALIGVILIVAICLVARNKRTIVSSVRKRNRNDIEETGAEDNATLLTTTNLSDED